ELYDNFKRVELACPKCGSEKVVKLPLDLFNGGGFGIIKIQVPIGGVCEEHNFMVLLNKEGAILGYETFDMMASKPSERGVEEKTPIDSTLPGEKALSQSVLQEYVNKYGFNCIVGYIHSKLFDYRAYLICRDDELIQIDEMESLFNAIIPQEYKNSHVMEVITYDPEIYPKPGYFFGLAKHKYSHAFIINPNRHVVNVPWKINIQYEKTMLRNALEGKDPETRIRLIRDFISKRITPEIAAKIIL
ncbi:MAG: hypothetical protein P8Y23_14565, partial [Candidatus Lokiarchaeota archaeon]